MNNDNNMVTRIVKSESIAQIYVPEVDGKNTRELIDREGNVHININGRYILIAIRHRDSLHWCGYLSLPEEHIWNGLHYDDIPIKCHGGLTFADTHIAGLDKFFVGFDCAHLGDISPGNKYDRHSNGTYKTLTYVMKELEDMYRQAVFALEESKS